MTRAKMSLPQGYTCKCGAEHDFPLYVFAHWRDELTHTCSECGSRYSIFEGRATLNDVKNTGKARRRKLAA